MGKLRAMRAHLRSPIRVARVSGESMAPTFADGDLILLRVFDQVPKNLPLGTVIVIEREVMPGIHFIKRIQKAHGGAYWAEGDNRDLEVEPRVNDSRVWGYIPAHEVRGRVLMRIWPLRWRAR